MSDTRDLTIIIPLEDHRNWAAECIESFSERQTAQRRRFRLIVVAAPRENESVLAGVKKCLSNADILLTHANDNLHEMYNAAVSTTRSPWLLLTEAHSLAEPACIEALLRRIDQDDVDLISCGSVGESVNSFAALEQQIFEEAWIEREKRGAAGGVVIRGFAVRRACFLMAGGFAPELGHFSEVLLGARLAADLGARYAHAPEAVVRHGNTTCYADLAPSLLNYGRGEILCRNTLPQAYCEKHFGPCPAWLRAQREHPRRTQLRLAAARLELAWARVCLHAAWPIPRLRYVFYRNLWRRLIRLGRSEALAAGRHRLPQIAH